MGRFKDLNSVDGRQRLLVFISTKSSYLGALSKKRDGVAKVCDTINKAKELVTTGASASPPAAAVVAGLFVVIELYNNCKKEAESMFKTASKMAEIIVRAATESDKVNARGGDSTEMSAQRQQLGEHYVQLY